MTRALAIDRPGARAGRFVVGRGVSVAAGAAFVGLGSDTGGSIRIPAALNGVVGFKNTARLVPTDGAAPLSTTLDTACAITRSVRDAIVVHEILAARRVTRSPAPLPAWRLAVPSTLFLDSLDATVAAAFERSCRPAAPCRADHRDRPAANWRLAEVNATGGFRPPKAMPGTARFAAAACRQL